MSTVWDWVNERHRIYCRRMAGEPWPWTEDQILLEYRFCNVFRELDKVTIWIREHWREPYADHPNLAFAMCVARWINWPDTLAELEDLVFAEEWDPEEAGRRMTQRAGQKHKVYTGAYIVSSAHMHAARRDPTHPRHAWSKHKWMTAMILEQVWRHRDALPSCTLAGAHRWLSQFHGWGGFMAYEVVTDLRHTRYLCDAPDTMTWANAGPGAIRGLNRIHGRPLDKRLKQAQACEEMRELLTQSRERGVLGAHVPLLEMRDIEHSLCEFDKYERVRLGQGRPRNKYHPWEI